MDNQSGETAESLINKLSRENLRKLFKDYGEERWAKQIANKIDKEVDENFGTQSIQSLIKRLLEQTTNTSNHTFR